LYAAAGSRETISGVDPVTGQPTGSERRVRLGGRATGDWGFLLNVGQRNAVGASLFGSVESIGHSAQSELGAFLRYRRWLGNGKSLDLALGMPVVLRNANAQRSPYGLVMLNLNRWIGVAVRPELRRSFGPTGYVSSRSDLFLSVGVEIGEKPGLALSALGATILGVRTLSSIGN
jgi:hypothetical protein